MPSQNSGGDRDCAISNETPTTGASITSIKMMLGRLGVLFWSGSIWPTASPISKACRQRPASGRLLVFFPEGTFTRRAGLSGFYLDAFRVAA